MLIPDPNSRTNFFITNFEFLSNPTKFTLFHDEERLKSALRLLETETPKRVVSFIDAFNLPWSRRGKTIYSQKSRRFYTILPLKKEKVRFTFLEMDRVDGSMIAAWRAIKILTSLLVQFKKKKTYYKIFVFERKMKNQSRIRW